MGLDLAAAGRAETGRVHEAAGTARRPVREVPSEHAKELDDTAAVEVRARTGHADVQRCAGPGEHLWVVEWSAADHGRHLGIVEFH
jgi:hypothetical protein